MATHLTKSTIGLHPVLYRVMFRVFNTTFCAGQYTAYSVDSGKAQAVELLKKRNLKTLESAEIQDFKGNTVALLRPQSVKTGKYEFITVR